MHIISMIVGGEDGGNERRRLRCVEERRWGETESWTGSVTHTSSDTTRSRLHLHLTPRATSSTARLRQYVYFCTSKASKVST